MMQVSATVLLLFAVALSPCPAWSAVAGAGQGLSPQTGKRLQHIHALIDQGRDEAAQQALEELLPRVGGRRYEKAVVLQNLGHVQASRERFDAASKAYEACLALQVLPQEVQQQIRYNLAQIYLAVDAPASAVPVLEEWFDLATDPGANAWLLLAHAYARLQRYREAVPAMEQAIDLAETPPAEWYETLLAMHFELESYRACTRLLQRMMRLFPATDAYWQQLSGLYLMLDDPARALSVLELTWRRGSVTREQDLLQLVHLYLYQEIPYKAARLLEDGMQSGSIETTPGHRELLASAWAQAREREAAIRSYRLAAQAGGTADIHLALAQLYLEDERWAEAARSLEAALEKEGMRDPGNAWLLLGIARYELDAGSAARVAFERAAGFDATRKAARQWLAHLDPSS